MAIPITIPRLGWNSEEGTFGGWLKNDGDEVQPGDRLFVFESEKAAEEIETLDGGILRIGENGPKTGDVLQVGAVIGYLVANVDEEVPTSSLSAQSKPSVASARNETAPERAIADRDNQTVSPRA